MKISPTFAAFPLAMVAAFMIGRKSADQAELTTEVANQALENQAKSDVLRADERDAGTSGILASRSEIEKSMTLSGKPSELQVQEIILMIDPLERSQALAELLGNITDPAEFFALIDTFRGMGLTRERRGEYAMMLSAWSKLDPNGALNYASENTGTPFARQTILSTWAGYDPDSAIAWAEANHDGEGANEWMVGVIEGLAAIDRERASQLMSELPRSRERGEALEAIVQQFTLKSANEALDWINHFDADDSLKNAAQNSIASLVAEKDLDRAVAWLDELSSTEGARRNAVDEVAAVWAKKDADGAISYVDTLSEDEKGQAAEGILRSLAGEDPQRAYEFLSSLEGTPDLQEATRNFIWGSYNEAPELAVDYLSQLRQGRNTNRVYRRVIESWVQKDESAAFAWLESNESVPESVKKRYLGE